MNIYEGWSFPRSTTKNDHPNQVVVRLLLTFSH